jgi:predicted phage terminase large subunit-like protein
MCGVRPYVRGTCNPDPDSFVADWIQWYLDDDGFPIEERSGKLRWLVRSGDDILWFNDVTEAKQASMDIHGQDARPKSFTFIAADIYDNPILMRKDPNYLSNLLAMDEVDMMRLLKGNWKIRPAAGLLFNRSWYTTTSNPPRGGVLVRFWDLAATEKKLKPSGQAINDPCDTAGVLMRLSRSRFTIEDVVAEQKGPAEIDDLIIATAKRDIKYAALTGATYKVRWEEEGGASGKRDSAHIVHLLRGFDAEGVKPDGDKYLRSKPFGSQSKAGNVTLIEGKWNQAWLNHMHNQPQKKKDIMDATSGAYTTLVTERSFSSASGGQEQLARVITAPTPR